MLRLRPGIYGYLQFPTVSCIDYWWNEIFEHVATKKSRRWKRDGWSQNITVMSMDQGRISHGQSRIKTVMLPASKLWKCEIGLTRDLYGMNLTAATTTVCQFILQYWTILPYILSMWCIQGDHILLFVSLSLLFLIFTYCTLLYNVLSQFFWNFLANLNGKVSFQTTVILH